MKIAIISDIHGNDVALKKILKEFSDYNYIINLGDTVGDQGDSDAVIEFLNNKKSRSILGNHDIEVLLDRSIGADRFTAEMLYQTKETYGKKVSLKPENIKFLKSLKPNFKFKRSEIIFGFYHSFYDFYKGEIFFESVKKNTNNAISLLEKAGCDILFIGHTHIPQLILADKNNDIRYINIKENVTIEYSHQTKYIINVGSIGSSRDPKIVYSYAVVDTETKKIQFIINKKRFHSYRL